MKTCVIIPAHNEASTIAGLVDAVKGQDLPVVVVDDGSTDDSARLAKERGAVVLRTVQNYGKGAALARGFTYALDQGFDAVITMDGDGQHLPQDIPVFLRQLDAEGSDMVVGNRMSDIRAMPYIRILTNRFMSWLLSRICRQRVCDSQCGFRLIRRRVLEKIRISTARFEVESEMILAACRRGFRIASVPIHTVYHGERSHINPVTDTIRFFRFICRKDRPQDE